MFFKLINLIKLNHLFKKKYFKTNISKNDLYLLKILITLNIIKYIKKLNKHKIIIFLQYHNNINIWKINNKFRLSTKYFLKSKTIKILTIKKKKLFLLSTNKGLMTNLKAYKHNTGGVLLCNLMLTD